MTPYTTEIYFSEFNFETQETLKDDLVSRLKEDGDVMADVTAGIIEKAEEDEESVTKKQMKIKTEDALREKADDILNRTFFEVSIGDQEL